MVALAWGPPGTKKIGLYCAASTGELRLPDGKKALDLTIEGGRFPSIHVPTGSDGQYWKFQNVAGRIYLLTIPPFLARIPAEMALPRP